MIQRVLARLLWLANGSPPHTGRDRFYAMKRGLLERYATKDGVDIQHVRKICYGCDGTGFYEDTGRDCRRCWGTGTWAEFWVELQRWEWCGYRFHTPGPKLYRKPETTAANITGYIEHRPRPGRWPDEAALWLALIYDRGLWWKLVTSCWHHGWTWCPMVNLRWLLTTITHEVGRARGGHCTRCGRWFTRLFDRRGHHFWCHACRRAPASVFDEDIPF